MSFIGEKLDFFARNSIISIFIICCIALFLRLYFFAPNLPIALDATLYFWYANDMSILGHFPTGHNVSNNGWPVFLSLFFSIFHFNDALDYMILQRVLTISISVLTTIPVYFLCRRYFEKPYAIVGASLFAFEPRIIQNSLQGLTEPLYIILITITLFLFLSNNKKLVYVSFGIAALCALVRAEGLFLFFAISIMFFVNFRKERLVIPKYAVAIAIFLLILLPMVAIRIQTTGTDGLTTRISSGSVFITSGIGPNQVTSGVFSNIVGGLESLIKFLGWSMIPSFLFFAPIGAFLVFRNRNYNNITIMLSLIALLLPTFYAFTRFSDTRYLLPLYPIFTIFSIFTIKKIGSRIRNRNTLLILIVCAILVSSWFFLIFKNVDIEHEKEALSIAQYVTKNIKVVNEYYPEGKYLLVTRVLDSQNFPVLQSAIPPSVKILPIFGFNSIEDYIKYGRNEGLTHLVLDGAKRNPDFLNDVFNNDTKYPYLIKVFDSWEHGYKYHVKIFKIDYDKFDSTIAT